MEQRNKTQKRPSSANAATTTEEPVVTAITATAVTTAVTEQDRDNNPDPFRNLLDESAREAFRRPWHRLERGLRLNRLRMYVEEMSAQCSFNAEEKNRFFAFLQNALDRKLLNTHKIVEYLPEIQKIKSIKGLEVRRLASGEAKWGFVRAKKTDGTRRIRKATAATATEKVEEATAPTSK